MTPTNDDEMHTMNTSADDTDDINMAAGLPALGECSVVRVELDEINIDDSDLDYRVEPEDDTLMESLRLHGQQIPVILCGTNSPFDIINGHRRIRSLRNLGATTVMAIVRSDITSMEQAHVAAFIEDNHHLQLDPVDRANLVSKLEDLNRSSDWIMAKLRISPTTLKEARRLRKMDKLIAIELHDRTINTRQALILDRYVEKLGLNLNEWVEKAKAGMSSREMEDALRAVRKAQKDSSPKPMIKRAKKGDGFSLRVRVNDDTTDEEKNLAIKAIEEAMEKLAAPEAHDSCDTDDSESDAVVDIVESDGDEG